MTLQGNVAVCGDADLMPEYARDEPAPRPREEPEDESVRTERRGTRRRAGGGITRWLRFLALPLIPWVLIMALTPWGRGLFNLGKAKAESLFGAGPAPSASAGAGAGSTAPSQPVSPQPSVTRSGPAVFQLDKPSGPRGASVNVTGSGFQASEEVQFLVAGKQVASLTADKSGKVKGSIVPASGTAKTGALVIQAKGRKSNRSATVTYTVTA